ncbi:MAG: DUF2834 domain-containing protein [Bacteroidota bacterium]
MKLKHIYLLAAVLGTVLPYYHLIQFIAEKGGSFPVFIDHLFTNSAATMGAIDLIISGLVFCVFVYFEGRRLAISNRWLYMLIYLVIGLSAALPLFLYVRQGKLSGHPVSEVAG